MTSRPRIDLDGVTLSDERDPGSVIAVLRFRTTEGVVLLIPESGDLTVGWDDVAGATLDLHSGHVRLTFAADYAARNHWLRGATCLVGRWVDRYVRGA